MSANNNVLPEVIDLFSGCGGFSLGFQSVGFSITHGVEIVNEAVETASYNLHWRYGKESGYICDDITKLTPELFKKDIGENGCIVIGGPPCQAYSLAGRAKLRSLGENRVNTNDKRGYLYQDFLKFAFGLEARAVIMENVPEATNFGGVNIPQTVCDTLEDHGYDAYWTVLNAADYGVPQIRERVFVIAIRKDEKSVIDLPYPTHATRQEKKTPSQQRFAAFSKYKNFKTPNNAKKDLPAWVTVGEAFGDLPELFPFPGAKYVLNKINMPSGYACEAQNDFQTVMREWFGKECYAITGNCFRNTPRDFSIFAEMKQGDDYLKASEIADGLFQQAVKFRGMFASCETTQYRRIKKEIVPPYDRDSFKDKWHKLRENTPSHTLVAHLSVDTYSHIHPVEPRGISVREAARLQSFPDDFLFQCSMGDAFKQIGNAVPPLLAKGIAEQVKNAFTEGN